MPDPDRLHIIRRLPWSEEPAAMQLAGGLALLAGLEQTGVPALRWYHMTPPALLLGSAQSPQEVDAAACALAGLAMHRRGSGGGAVLSDDMLMLDLALPREHPLYLSDVTESYRAIGEVWLAALLQLGIDAQLVSVDQARADAQALDVLIKRVCFGGISPYETVVKRRKVVGLAQIRRRAGALFQVGLYLHWAPQRTAALMAATALERTRLAEQLAERAVGLDELCSWRQPEIEVVTGAFEAALARLIGLAPSSDDWIDGERTARSAAVGRYATLDL